jgi:hypothetical protein
MGRGNPVVLSTRGFATQLLATSYFKDMLGRYRPGDRVSDLMRLISLHCSSATMNMPQRSDLASTVEVMMTEHEDAVAA